MSDLVKAFTAGISNPEFEKGLTEWRIKIQNFTKKINSQPDQTKVRSKQGIPYLPVSYVETTLDEMFFGQWSTCDFVFQQIANEIVGSITLKVLHPVTGIWIERSGAAAVQIMQDKDASIDSILQTKKKNALETGFPKLKAMCLKNAALSIGRNLGRDLSRKQNDTTEYRGMVINTGDWKDVLDILNSYEGDDIDSIREEVMQKRASCALSAEYVAELKERCNGDS